MYVQPLCLYYMFCDLQAKKPLLLPFNFLRSFKASFKLKNYYSNPPLCLHGQGVNNAGVINIYIVVSYREW